MTGTVTLERIGQIGVRVRDLARATAFYRDVLGLPVVVEAPNLSIVDCGGTWLLLGGAEAPEFDHPASVLYFDVQDTDAAYEALRAKGVAFRAAPHAVHREPSRELRMAFFGDGEGNTFAIRAWRPAAGSAA